MSRVFHRPLSRPLPRAVRGIGLMVGVDPVVERTAAAIASLRTA